VRLHPNAKLTPAGRHALARQALEQGRAVREVTAVAQVSRQTLYKWLHRFRSEGRRGFTIRARDLDASPSERRARRRAAWSSCAGVGRRAGRSPPRARPSGLDGLAAPPGARPGPAVEARGGRGPAASLRARASGKPARFRAGCRRWRRLQSPLEVSAGCSGGRRWKLWNTSEVATRAKARGTGVGTEVSASGTRRPGSERPAPYLPPARSSSS
jgi:transposase-like protein